MSYAELGRYAEAEAAATRALEGARRAGTVELVAGLEERRALYRAQRPFREAYQP